MAQLLVAFGVEKDVVVWGRDSGVHFQVAHVQQVVHAHLEDRSHCLQHFDVRTLQPAIAREIGERTCVYREAIAGGDERADIVQACPPSPEHAPHPRINRQCHLQPSLSLPPNGQQVFIVYHCYAVTGLGVVPATAVSVTRPTSGATLTLITCTPYGVDTDRLVARARLL